MQLPFILITGPTGVGKSACALQLAQRINGEIINGDVGQAYVPLTIGTAKPCWREEAIPHHLFDIINEPSNYSAASYREQVISAVKDICKRGRTPIVVGGSLFYLKSLFFPPRSKHASHDASATWETLFQLDPIRAAAIDPHDSYRIARAVALARTGTQPSALRPLYDPLHLPFIIIHLTRDREDLYCRINERTLAMFHEGWIAEVEGLSLRWQSWLLEKKIIGYDTIISHLRSGISRHECIALIQQRTRNYAKRQLTFWRSFHEQIEQVAPHSSYECNLTLSPVTLYLERILEMIITVK